MSDEKFGLTFTPSGIATMWLRGNCPDAGSKQIASLTQLIECMYLDGMTNGMKQARDVIAKSPTLSAADATLEADIGDVVRKAKEKVEDPNALDIDLGKL